jgi:S-methylmethionine-dependent homocysteine/selenocysteine methylase
MQKPSKFEAKSYRNALPQLSDGVFLTDAGVETDLIFNHGIEIREFAAFTLLGAPQGRAALTRYFEGFLDLAKERNAGFILDTTTWKAHAHWAKSLGMDTAELREANEEGVRFIADLRARYSTNTKPIVLSAVVGPRGDAYRPEGKITTEAAEEYFSEQLAWLAATEADMVSAMTFNQASEAAGLARAARRVGMPAMISFTVETNGALPTGQSLADAITQVDEATDAYPAYYMINCAHPDHFRGVLQDAPWARRIRGVRANASRKSHAELDASTTLDSGNPQELASDYCHVARRMPWLNVFGGCCGSDLRHVTEIARSLPTAPRA